MPRSADVLNSRGQEPEQNSAISSTKIPDFTDPRGLIDPTHVETAHSLHWTQPWEQIIWMQEYLRAKNQPLVVFLGMSPLPTDYGDWTYATFGDATTGEHHDLLVFGDVNAGSLEDGEDVLVRVHSSCKTNEAFHARNCECRAELKKAMKDIQRKGRGILLYLEQEGRGTGIKGKQAQLNGMFEWRKGKVKQRRDPKTGARIDTDRAYKEAGYPSEVRDFSVAGAMLKHFGVKSVRLLTNNPRKISGLEEQGIKVTAEVIHIKPENKIIRSDLRAKASELGHDIQEKHLKVRKKGKKKR